MSDDFLKGLALIGLGAGGLYLVGTKTNLLGDRISKKTYLTYSGTSDYSNDSGGGGSGEGNEKNEATFNLGETPIEDAIANATGSSFLGDAYKTIAMVFSPLTYYAATEVVKKDQRDKFSKTIVEAGGSNDITITY